MAYVDLQRRFIALRDDREETLARIEAARALGQGDAGWSDVLGCPRAVVLAEAGADKTAEPKAQRDRLCRAGGFALVLPLEGLAGGGVEACCTPDELAAFEAWRAAAPVDGFESVPRGWFLLDAVDEAGAFRAPVDLDGAGAADADPAPVLGPVQADMITQDPEETIILHLLGDGDFAPVQLHQNALSPCRYSFFLYAPGETRLEPSRQIRCDGQDESEIGLMSLFGPFRTKPRDLPPNAWTDDNSVRLPR